MPGINPLVVTPGVGQTINTLGAGQANMANSHPFAIANDQSPIPVISQNSSAITNPPSTLARSANATTGSVTVSTTTSPYFTWSGANPPVNGQGFFLGGTAVPNGFTPNTTYWVRDVAGNTFNLAATGPGGATPAAIVPTSTGTAVTATLEYKPGDMVANAAAAGSVTPPSFAIANNGGGVIIPRIRLRTSAVAWGGAILQVSLWSAQPTYSGGDGQLYAPATGSAAWLGDFLVTLAAKGDGAVGAGTPVGANEIAVRLASGTAIYWDVSLTQTSPFNMPVANQVFNLFPELLN